MSRIGKNPIQVPAGIDVVIEKGTIKVKGKSGQLSFTHHSAMKVTFDAATRQIKVERPDDERQNRALHGLTRALIANMVKGVETPFVRKLEIIGVGYTASITGKTLQLLVGFANPIRLPIPDQVTCEVPDATHLVLK
ncbi:MAG: 50S ribosomal protein L6, partial [Cryobacterium sp.]|nr:50S ribosomal protein L6 [Cryobacterium sp.]